MKVILILLCFVFTVVAGLAIAFIHLDSLKKSRLDNLDYNEKTRKYEWSE